MLLLSKGWLSSVLARMVAEHGYLDLRLDPSLETRDFDPTNPEYAFPRWKIGR